MPESFDGGGQEGNYSSISHDQNQSTPLDLSVTGYIPSSTQDALEYLDQVKDKFRNQPQVYNDFLEILTTYKSGEWVILTFWNFKTLSTFASHRLWLPIYILDNSNFLKKTLTYSIMWFLVNLSGLIFWLKMLLLFQRQHTWRNFTSGQLISWLSWADH